MASLLVCSCAFGFDSQPLVDHLTVSGWPKRIAEKVIDLNNRRYKILDEEAPEELEKELKVLSKLRFDPDVDKILRLDPEVAGLLCMANRPKEVAKGLLASKPGTPLYDKIKGKFTVITDSWEIDRWARVVQRHSGLIEKLIDAEILFPEPFLVHAMEDTKASHAYSDWLEGLFAPWPKIISDESFYRRLDYVATSGTAIYTRMKRDETFRRRFSDEIWPVIGGLSESDPAVLHPEYQERVWDLIMDRSDAKYLLERGGLFSAEILVGRDAIHKDVQEKVVQYILSADWELLDALERYRSHPALISIMKKEAVGPATLRSLFQTLDDAGETYPAKLDELSILSGSELFERLNPTDPGAKEWVPGYSAYFLAKKAYYGRPIKVGEWFSAGIDVVSCIPVFTPLKAGKVVQMVGKATREGTKQIAKKAVGRNVARTAREIAKAAEGSGPLKFDSQMTSFFANKALPLVSKELRNELLTAGNIDITSSIRGAFDMGRKLGFNRESFKMLTGLEARIFQRADRKVIFNLPEALLGRTHSAAFINMTAEDAVGHKVGELTPTAVELGKTTVQWGKDMYSEHISAWWLGLASGNIAP